MFWGHILYGTTAFSDFSLLQKFPAIKKRAASPKLSADFFFCILHLHVCWRAVKKAIADFWSCLNPYFLRVIWMMFHGLIWGRPLFISEVVIIPTLSTNGQRDLGECHPWHDFGFRFHFQEYTSYFSLAKMEPPAYIQFTCDVSLFWFTTKNK